MINIDTINLIKENLNITNKAVVSYPMMPLVDDNRTIVSFINLEKLDVQQFEPFGIYNLSQFIQLLSKIYSYGEEFNVKKEKNRLVITNTDIVQEYTTTDIELLKDYNIPYDMIKKIRNSYMLYMMKMKKELLNEIKTFITIKKSDYVIMDVENDVIIITSMDMNDNYIDPTYIEIGDNVVSKDEKGGKIIFDSSLLLKTITSNYDVLISKNEKTGSNISLWECNEKPIEMVITTINY